LAMIFYLQSNLKYINSLFVKMITIPVHHLSLVEVIPYAL